MDMNQTWIMYVQLLPSGSAGVLLKHNLLFTTWCVSFQTWNVKICRCISSFGVLSMQQTTGHWLSIKLCSRTLEIVLCEYEQAALRRIMYFSVLCPPRMYRGGTNFGVWVIVGSVSTRHWQWLSMIFSHSFLLPTYCQAKFGRFCLDANDKANDLFFIFSFQLGLTTLEGW